MDVLVTGTIMKALPVQSGVSQRGNQWMRVSYILEHEHGQYPKQMVIDVNNAKIQELNLQVGETVTLHLNISCREHPQGSGKYFNSIEAWKADRMGGVQQPQQFQQQVYAPQPGYAPQPAPFPVQPVAQPAPFPAQQPVAQPQPVQQPVAAPFPPAQPQPAPAPAPAPAPQPAPQPQVQQPTQSPLPFPPAQ